MEESLLIAKGDRGVTSCAVECSRIDQASGHRHPVEVAEGISVEVRSVRKNLATVMVGSHRRYMAEMPVDCIEVHEASSAAARNADFLERLDGGSLWRALEISSLRCSGEDITARIKTYVRGQLQRDARDRRSFVQGWAEELGLSYVSLGEMFWKFAELPLEESPFVTI